MSASIKQVAATNKLRLSDGCLTGGDLLVCIDEAGSSAMLVRRLISASPGMICALKTTWGFDDVRFFAAGTGIEGEAMSPGRRPYCTNL